MSFHFTRPFPLGPDTTPYRKLTSSGVRVEKFGTREMLVVDAEALRLLAETAMIDINHLLRPGHLAQLAKILEDPEATENDRFVAYDLLKMCDQFALCPDEFGYDQLWRRFGQFHHQECRESFLAIRMYHGNLVSSGVRHDHGPGRLA